MRKALLVALAVMMCGFYAVAQDYPKAEVFGGFSLLHVDTEGATNASAAAFTGVAGTTIKIWYPVWEVAEQYNFTKMLGVKADFSGNYGTPLSVPGVSTPSARTYTFLGGPVFSFRHDRITPFAHALFGGNHVSVDSFTVTGEGGFFSPAFSETAFAMALGGGVDWKLTHHFSVRLGQFDYLYTNHCLSAPPGFFDIGTGQCLLGVPGAPADHQNNFRFSTGIVIH